MRKLFSLLTFASLLANLLFVAACASSPKKVTKNPEQVQPHKINYIYRSNIIIPNPILTKPVPPDYDVFLEVKEVDSEEKRGGLGKSLTWIGRGVWATVDPLNFAIYEGAGLTGIIMGQGLSMTKSKLEGTDSNKEEDYLKDIPREPDGISIKRKVASKAKKLSRKLVSADYDVDPTQIEIEYYVKNNYASPIASATELKECLFSYYIDKIAENLEAHFFHRHADKYFIPMLWLEKERAHQDIPGGRRLSSDEIDEIYKNCFTRIKNGETIQFREAIIKYRIKNNIPGLKTTLDEYIRCVDEYEKQTETKDFLAFEFEFMKKARDSRNTDQKAAIPPAETQKDKLATN